MNQFWQHALFFLIVLLGLGGFVYLYGYFRDRQKGGSRQPPVPQDQPPPTSAEVAKWLLAYFGVERPTYYNYDPVEAHYKISKILLGLPCEGSTFLQALADEAIEKNTLPPEKIPGQGISQII